jgi:diacylglycerol kinase (ATP)
MRHVMVSMNPRAGSQARHDHINRIVAGLQAVGFSTEVSTDLEELAKKAASQDKAGQLRAVLACGGDGTAAAVRSYVPLDIPLLVVPMGTENLLGTYLRQSIEPDAIVQVIENGVVVELDLCQANGKSFLSMISAGFDAAVVRSLHENRLGNIHRLAYLRHIVLAIRRYDYPSIRVRWDAEGAKPIDCRWLFAFNLPLYALGLPVAPDAVGTDGLLDLCWLEQGSAWSVARYLWHIVRREHFELADAGQQLVQRFHIESIDGAEIAYQLDGDFAGVLPVEVQVLPKMLRLLVSQDMALRLGFEISQRSQV